MTSQQVHRRYGGSSAPRWLNCVGSVALNDKLPDVTSEHARRGSARHWVAEQCLKRNAHPNAFLGKPVPHFPGIAVDQAMVDELVIFLNAVTHEMALSPTAQVFVENEVRLALPGCADDDVGGYPDVYVYHPELERLRVFDGKFGFQDVAVDDNAQLKFYANCILNTHRDWRVREIVLTVVQPGGLDHRDVRDWTFDRIELLEFRGDIEAAVKRGEAFARDGHGQDVFNPGPWCANTYCKAFAAGACPAVAAKAMAGIGMDFDGLKPVTPAEITSPDLLPEPKTLDLEQLAKIVDGLDYLTTWAGRCQQYLEGMMLAGAQAPGWKVVDKVGRAKWVDDPAKVAAYCDAMFDIPASQITPPSLITITEATKRLKAAGATKEQIDSFKLKFTVKDSSGRTIARASDSRPAVDVVASDFAGVNVAAIAAE